MESGKEFKRGYVSILPSADVWCLPCEDWVGKLLLTPALYDTDVAIIKKDDVLYVGHMNDSQKVRGLDYKIISFEEFIAGAGAHKNVIIEINGELGE